MRVKRLVSLTGADGTVSGLDLVPSGEILFGNGTNTFDSDPALAWDDANKNLELKGAGVYTDSDLAITTDYNDVEIKGSAYFKVWAYDDSDAISFTDDGADSYIETDSHDLNLFAGSNKVVFGSGSGGDPTLVNESGDLSIETKDGVNHSSILTGTHSIYDISDTQYTTISHDGTQGVLQSSTNLLQLVVTGVNLGSAHTLGITSAALNLNCPTITSAGSDDYALVVNQTLNDTSAAAGTQTYNGLKINLTTTDTTGWDSGVYALSVYDDGNIRHAMYSSGMFYCSGKLTTGSSAEITATGYYGFGDSSRSRIYAPADGQIKLTNAANDNFSLLQFGGTTNAYPALKRESTNLSIVRADDSGYTGLTCSGVTSTSNISVTGSGFFSGDIRAGAAQYIYWSGRALLASPSNGTITLTNSTVTDFSLLQFGGTTNAFPALKRRGLYIESRLADDSNYAPMYASGFTMPNGGALVWDGNSRITGTANGYITLSNGTSDDFVLLRFGGTTSSFPAIKRSSTRINFKLADDSNLTDIGCNGITCSGTIQASGGVGGTQLNVYGAIGSGYYGGFDRKADNGLYLAVNATDGRANHNCILITEAAVNDDYAHTTPSTNPTLILHSATRAATATDQWMSLSHDQTDGIIGLGKGSLKAKDSTGNLAGFACATCSGVSPNWYGVVAESDTTSPARSPFRIVPQDAAPTVGAIGDIYVSTAGVLYICTNATGPVWTAVGSQS